MRVKICCISSIEEANLAMRLGASELGLVSAMPSGPGVISETRIAEIAPAIPLTIGSFLLTSLVDAAQIITQQKKCGVNTIQVCDRLAIRELRILRKALPEISIVQVIHVVDEGSVQNGTYLSVKISYFPSCQRKLASRSRFSAAEGRGQLRTGFQLSLE
jgi:phosphoribosylanthranilate isomerase